MPLFFLHSFLYCSTRREIFAKMPREELSGTMAIVVKSFGTDGRIMLFFVDFEMLPAESFQSNLLGLPKMANIRNTVRKLPH